MSTYSFITIFLPIIIILVYMYRKDKYMKEPWDNLFRAFCYGILAFPVYFVLLFLLSPIFPEDGEENFLQIILSIFCISSVPIEGAKLFFLWLLLRRNKNFNEYIDGIVYATFIAMGFALVEASIIIFSEEKTLFSMMGLRSFLSVPLNWFYAILMGYYFSLAKFSETSKIKYGILSFLAPVLCHAAYDCIITSVPDIDPMFEGVAFVVFLFICYKLWIFATKKMEEHLERDKILFNIDKDDEKEDDNEKDSL